MKNMWKLFSPRRATRVSERQSTSPWIGHVQQQARSAARITVAMYGISILVGALLGLGMASLQTPTLPRQSIRAAPLPTVLANQATAVPTATIRPDNPTLLENQQTGSNKWQLNLAGFKAATDAEQQIAGYASSTSANKGEQITFYITVTPVQTYTIDIYRIGWYNGRGGRRLQHLDPQQGTHQSACPPDPGTGLIACSWTPSYTLNIPTNWTSGIYLALLTNAHNFQNYIVFVVRDDARKADLLYQQSVTTYQAYNNYPDDGKTGKSLYNFNSYGPQTISREARAVKVSFDRPYNYGAGQFMNWEINFVRWLERTGYDVAYSTDVDTHANGQRLLTYKGFLAVGHDEYWSKEIYDSIEAARNNGVHLGFFSADDASWQVRFEPSASGVPNRVMVCYKDASIDPVQGPTTTVEWRDAKVNRAEQSLIGVQYTSQLTNSERLKNNAPLVVLNSSHWVYAGTNLKDGDSIPNLVGYEADRSMPDFPNPLNKSFTILSKSPFTNTSNKPDFSNTVIYQAPSGAWVFAAGTIAWSWGLDDYNDRKAVDPRIQRITENILDRFISEGGSNE
jgi:hypothetical protein